MTCVHKKKIPEIHTKKKKLRSFIGLCTGSIIKMGDPNSRKKQALNRLRSQLRKKKESLADQFDFKMYIAFVFKDKVK